MAPRKPDDRWPALPEGGVYGVRTTRIYCRAGCPARPKPENILVFADGAAARADGYRPCRRCRPDDTGAPPGVRQTA